MEEFDLNNIYKMKKMAFISLIFLVGCFFASSFSYAEEAAISGENHWSGVSARLTEPRQLVVRTDTDWQRLWLDDIGRLPPLALPPNTEAYAIFAGQRNTGGYGVTIHEAIEEADYVRINYSETRPNRYDMVVMMMTSPYAVFLAPDSKKEPIFVEIERP